MVSTQSLVVQRRTPESAGVRDETGIGILERSEPERTSTNGVEGG
jgi:hypothetical protein